jgi:C1A family cysteine protease
MSHPQYKLTYHFQQKDPRDFIHRTIVHPDDAKLEITTVVKRDVRTIQVVKASPTMFTVSKLPSILDQSSLGSCVSNAFSFCVSKQTNKAVQLSRLFLYAICRCIDDTLLSDDSGTTIRTACQSIAKYGVCKEQIYPYNISIFSNLPPLNVFNNSKRFRKFTYTFISQDITSIKNSLYTKNNPIIFGFMVYSSFMSTNSNGQIPIPDVNNEALLGGHCMTIVGYNDVSRKFTCANSWGTGWGNKGYCYMPYDYLLDTELASDFCVTTFIY